MDKAKLGESENLEDDKSYLKAYILELEEKVKLLEGEVSKLKAERGTQKKKKKLNIVHFNDVYHLESGKEEPVGGLARVASALDELEKHNPLITVGGDFLGPSLMSNITKGSHMIEALNLLGTHYGIIGNHDLDFGVEVLAKRLKKSTSVWLLSNLVDPKTKEPLAGAKASALFEFNGVKVGMIGVVENWVGSCSKLSPENALYLDMVQTSKSLIKELKANGAELIVALTHNRVENDRVLAEQVPEIDLILGGHDHTYESFQLNGVTSVKSGTDWQELSFIEISIKEGLPRPAVHFPVGRIPVTKRYAPKPTISEFDQRYEKIIKEKLGKKVGETSEDIDASELIIRHQESSLGNWIADTIRAYNNADIGLINGGAIRANSKYPKGNLALSVIHEWLPYEDVVMSLAVTGAQVLQIVENSVSQLPGESGRFSHFSGLRFKFKRSVPKGNRVTEITVRDKPLDKNATYTLAVGTYVASGKDGFGALENCPRLKNEEESTLIQDILRQQFVKTPVISPKIDGRITQLD